MLNVLDEFTHECLAIRVARKLKAIDVIDVLSDLFILRGVPAHIRSDNGPSSSPRPCGNGSQLSVPRPPTSSGVALGRTATSRASTPAFAMSCSTGDLLHFAGGPDHHRELATPLQHDQASRLHRIQATSTRGVPACIRRVAGCATPTGSAGHAGATANLKLTFHLDHSAGADQSTMGITNHPPDRPAILFTDSDWTCSSASSAGSDGERRGFGQKQRNSAVRLRETERWYE